MKITLVGTGRVGSAIAFALTINPLASELLLLNRSRDKAEGDAMDLTHAAALLNSNMNIHAQGASQYAGQCKGESANHERIVKEILPYIIKQKKSKRDRRAFKTVPGIGLLESIKAGVNKVRKHCDGSLGKKRTLYSEILAAHLIVGNCKLCELIVAELYDFESMVWIKNHCEIFPAAELLADKMKSR